MLERELGGPPTAARVAERTGTSVEQVLEARMAADARHGQSFDRPTRDADGEGQTLADTFGTVDPGLAQAEDTATLDRLMATLGDREREILRLRFHEDLTQAEIGEQLGISQMHVSRLIRQSVTRLRAAAGEL